MLHGRRIGFVFLGALNACLWVRPAAAPPDARATMRDASGASLGVLLLQQTSDGVRITGTLSPIPPGIHGIHFHTVGQCDPADFSKAGAHLNPTAAQHGLDNPAGPHAGDLLNISATVDRQAVVKL